MTALRKPSVWLALAATVAVVAFLLLVAPNYRLYLIHTGSMTGTIPSGSAVLVEKGTDVHVGEVITFHRDPDGAIVTHRLIAVLSDGTLETKGDANPTPDLGSIPRPNVIGHVVAAPKYLGGVIHFMSKTTLGYVFDVLLLVILWVAVPGGKKRPARHRPTSHRARPAQPAAPPAPPPADDQPTMVIAGLHDLFDRV